MDNVGSRDLLSTMVSSSDRVASVNDHYKRNNKETKSQPAKRRDLNI